MESIGTGSASESHNAPSVHYAGFIGIILFLFFVFTVILVLIVWHLYHRRSNSVLERQLLSDDFVEPILIEDDIERLDIDEEEEVERP